MGKGERVPPHVGGSPAGGGLQRPKTFCLTWPLRSNSSWGAQQFSAEKSPGEARGREEAVAQAVGAGKVVAMGRFAVFSA